MDEGEAGKKGKDLFLVDNYMHKVDSEERKSSTSSRKEDDARKQSVSSYEYGSEYDDEED